MDSAAIRNSTKTVAESLGYRFNPSLPLLDEIRLERDCNEVVNRILAVYASVACAYGFPKAKAIDWLKNEGLWQSVTESERAFLEGNAETRKPVIRWQVEALWSLTWAAGYHDELDFANPCPDSFVGIFPDLKTGETAANFKEKCRLRSIEVIGKYLDLSYCLHWAIRDSELSNASKPTKVEGQVIIERRRALEWLVGDDEWDNVSLDT